MVKHTRSLRSSLAAALLVAAGCIGAPIDEAPENDAEEVAVSRNQAALISTCSATTPVNPLKELFIVDPSVVDSPEANNAGPTGGLLSFHRTMRTLAGNQDVAQFTERFFENWETTQFVGRGITEARPGVAGLLDNAEFWPRLPNGKLDMEKAPFRLLGVVNRMDLLGTAPNKPNGEGRLVYGLFFPGEPTRDTAKGIGQTFSIIFEFNLPSTHSLRDWAQRWHNMGSLNFGQNSTGRGAMPFNVLLWQNVVNEYVAPANLSQVRTNEIQFGSPWQLREFNLSNGSLVAATTKQSPEPTLNNSAELLNWVKANKNAILSNTHVVPNNLLGGTSNEDFPRFCGQGPCDTSPDTFGGTRWLMTTAAQNGIEESVRFAFANQTCNGCHNSDVEPNSNAGVLQFFYQVAPTLGVNGTDGTGRLSDFIKNQELPSRAKVLSGLLSCNCIASYRVAAAWSTGTESYVKLTNISNTTTNSWGVKWRYDSAERVTSNWDSQRVSGVAEPNYEFRNASWNFKLTPGQSVQFGVMTSTSGLAPIPSELIASCQ